MDTPAVLLRREMNRIRIPVNGSETLEPLTPCIDGFPTSPGLHGIFPHLP